MTQHGSASPRPQPSRIPDANVKRRARRLAVDDRIDPRTRNLIRYALGISDPYLNQIVTRLEAGETRIDHLVLDSD